MSQYTSATNRNSGWRRRMAPIASGQNGLSWAASRRLGSDALAQVRRDHLGLEQHRHVATDAVAAIGHRAQLRDLRLPESAVAVIELQRVRPSR